MQMFGLPLWFSCKESTHNMGDVGLIPDLGRAPGEGKGYPLQYSGLENSMGYIVHGNTELDMTEWLSLKSYLDHLSYANVLLPLK